MEPLRYRRRFLCQLHSLLNWSSIHLGLASVPYSRSSYTNTPAPALRLAARDWRISPFLLIRGLTGSATV